MSQKWVKIISRVIIGILIATMLLGKWNDPTPVPNIFFFKIY